MVRTGALSVLPLRVAMRIQVWGEILKNILLLPESLWIKRRKRINLSFFPQTLMTHIVSGLAIGTRQMLGLKQ